MKWRRRSGKRWARPASAGGEGSTTGGGPAASAPRAQEPARAAAGQRREARAAPPRNARRVCLIVNAGPVPIVRDDGGGHFGHDGPAMWTALVDSLVYFPDRRLYGDPGDVSLAFTDLTIPTADGERLHGWWVPTRARPARGHVLFFHGNAGNISHRLEHALAL